MAIEHVCTVEGDLLHVTAWGYDGSLQDTLRYGQTVIEAMRTHHCQRVLCDERELEYRLGTLDTFKYAEFVAAQAPSIARAAIVTTPDNLPDASFFENVVVNRGLTLRFFRSLEAATTWLGEG